MEFIGSEIKPHQLFNELDKFGLLLGLERLPLELNAPYKERLLDVFANRADSTTRGLVNGITRELGLKIKQEILIVPTSTDPDVGIAIKGTKLCIYSNYYDKTFLQISGVDQEYDLWDLEGGAYTIQEVLDIFALAEVPFQATHLGTDLGKRSATLLEETTYGDTEKEELSGKGLKINLRRDFIASGSEYVYPSYLTKVSTAAEVVEEDQYHIDYISGTITTLVLFPPGSYIRYNYKKEKLYIESSPIIIGNLQSQDLREKMFEQVTQPDGQPAISGRPTRFGADIINELLSVHPVTYGK